jgi:hypothetical protein
MWFVVLCPGRSALPSSFVFIPTHLNQTLHKLSPDIVGMYRVKSGFLELVGAPTEFVVRGLEFI